MRAAAAAPRCAERGRLRAMCGAQRRPRAPPGAAAAAPAVAAPAAAAPARRSPQPPAPPRRRTAALPHTAAPQRGSAGMFWRFYVVEDRTVSRFIVRDADARLTARDRAAVAEWEQSGRYFHTIHDHFNHIRPAMGGMWGAVGGFVSPQAIREWRAADGAARAAHPKKSDQFWLQDKVWPAAKAHALDHSSWHCNRHGAAEGRGLPTKRDGPRDFVGNVHDAGNGYRGMSLAAECPLECRRKPEWKFC